MTDPPRISFVTLGARDLPRLRRFDRGWGWVERPGSDGEPVPDPGRWNGITLAVDVATRAEVDAAHARAPASGATVVAAPTDRAWGGDTGDVADPEGNRWELAWAPV